MRPFIIICHLLLLVYYAGFSQQPASSSGKCKQDLDVVEKAFSAFAADSIRKPDYYFKASKAAENILKTCGLNDEAKKIIGIKRTIIDLYARSLPYYSYYSDYNRIRSLQNPPQIKKLFKKEIDSLKDTTDPDFRQYVLYLKGTVYANILDDPASAIGCFREALEIRPEWVPALNAIALAHLSDHKNDSSEIYIEKCLRLSKTYSPAYYTKARLAFDAKNVKAAFGFLRTAKAIDPLNPRYYIEIAYRHKTFQMYDSAKIYYDQAKQIDPEYVPAYLHLAELYWEEGDTEKTMSFYKKCIDINPNLANLYAYLGYFKSELSDEEYIKHYEQAVTLDSSYLFLLGEINHDKEEYEKAIEIYRRSLNYSFDKITCRNIAMCYYMLRKYKESIEFLEEAIQMDSTYAEAHYWLGEIYDTTEYKNKAKAIYHFKKAFLLDPNYDVYIYRYYLSSGLDALEKKEMRNAYEIFYEGYKNGCDSCLFYANALKYEYGFDATIDKEEAVEWYSIILRANNSEFAWKSLLNLSSVWERKSDNMEWDSTYSYNRNEIPVFCYTDNDSTIQGLTITLYENYPKGMHPILWEALRIKKEFNASFFPDDRQRFQDYYTDAQKYSSSFPYYASYYFEYIQEDKALASFEASSRKIHLEQDLNKKMVLLDSLITSMDDIAKKQNTPFANNLAAKAYILYGNVLDSAGEKEAALEKFNSAIATAPSDTSIINKVSRIKLSRFGLNLSELLEVSSEEELIAYFDIYLQKKDTKTADIIFQKINAGNPSAQTKYSIYQAYLANGYDKFNELLLSDPDEDNIYAYSEYLLTSITNAETNLEKVLNYEKLFKLDEKLLKLTPDKDLREEIAKHCNSFGWYALLIKDFSRAKTAISRGLELDKTYVYLVGNEPHTLLFTGQEEKAIKKYLELKDQPFGKLAETGYRSFKEAFLSDFDEFEKANYSDKDLEKIERIKRILNNK